MEDLEVGWDLPLPFPFPPLPFPLGRGGPLFLPFPLPLPFPLLGIESPPPEPVLIACALGFVDSHFVFLGQLVNCLHNRDDVLMNIIIRGSDGHISLSLTQGFGQREGSIVLC